MSNTRELSSGFQAWEKLQLLVPGDVLLLDTDINGNSLRAITITDIDHEADCEAGDHFLSIYAIGAKGLIYYRDNGSCSDPPWGWKLVECPSAGDPKPRWTNYPLVARIPVNPDQESWFYHPSAYDTRDWFEANPGDYSDYEGCETEEETG